MLPVMGGIDFTTWSFVGKRRGSTERERGEEEKDRKRNEHQAFYLSDFKTAQL